MTKFKNLFTAVAVTAGLLAGIFGISSIVSTSASAADIVYGPVVSITTGGTYSPSSIGVDINTTQPVVLENCYVKADNRSLVKSVAGANVTVRNCSFEGSSVPNNAGHRAIALNNVASVRVENNDFLHIGAVRIQGGIPTIAILNNKIRDVIGDETNCCGGGYAPGFQLVQLTSPNAEIAWNEIINLPGQSNMEDGVNLFAASGTTANPIRIHDNFIWGAYPLPITSGYSGGGILSGDGGGGTNNILVTENQIVGTTNYGIQIGGGNNVKMERNRAVSSGLTASGREIPAQNTNPFWTYNTAPTNSSMSNNVWAWMRGPNSRWPQGKWYRADSWMPACGSNGNTCGGNQSLTLDTSARIYYSAEQAEYDLWLTKYTNAGQIIGRIGSTPVTTTSTSTTTTVAPTTTTTVAPTTTTTQPTTTTKPCRPHRWKACW